VPIPDLPHVKALGFQLVLKRFQPGVDPEPYLDAAGASGLKVLAWFPGTYALGWSNPAALDPWVAQVKTNPALYGYISVIEPGDSHTQVPITVIRALYRHLKALDPTHPVIVSYGHLPVFGTDANPFTSGVADTIIAEWYPVVFPTSYNPSGWMSTTTSVLQKVRAVVAAQAPGTPVWLTIQMHEYVPTNKRQPSFADVVRQMNTAFDTVGATGLVFYPWHTSSNYTADLKGSSALQASVAVAISWLRTGYFNR
jgi:hypothetical protein